MSVGKNDRLQVKTMFVYRLDYFLGIVSGIDADCLLSSLAANNPSVLLKGGDGDLFYDHN
jgi:hypothetical protein